MQLPPEISALKVNGKPSHRAARKGETLELFPRPVVVSSLTRRSPVEDGAVKISVTCGKGTYIRGIVRDIGIFLGCGAHVESLRRLSTGPFLVSDAFSALVSGAFDSRALRPLRDIGTSFHRVILTEDAERRLLNGLCVPIAEAGHYVPGTVELRQGLCVEGKTMIGFADVVRGLLQDGGTLLKPRVNIALDDEDTCVED
jgi:tRNA U55 pseudouridine synthase TruB